eukprot:gb/GECH01011486.1/.p1 GENE.gb/GECH01011486.1/~~gb/GECH01011486.1/.p1  ORF type:complete len:160 (+),score=16.10 gb/GECH01011486.1/:1-480(+)
MTPSANPEDRDPWLDYPNITELPHGRFSDSDLPMQYCFWGTILTPCLVGLCCLLCPKSYFYTFANDNRIFIHRSYPGACCFRLNSQEKKIPYEDLYNFQKKYISNEDGDEQYVYIVTKSGEKYRLRKNGDPSDQEAPQFMKKYSNRTGIPIKWHLFAGT